MWGWEVQKFFVESVAKSWADVRCSAAGAEQVVAGLLYLCQVWAGCRPSFFPGNLWNLFLRELDLDTSHSFEATACLHQELVVVPSPGQDPV